MVARDAGRTIRFYEELLGLRFTQHPDELVFGGILSFVVRPAAPRGHWGVGGVHHVALGVEDEAAQLRWKRRLMDAGVSVSGPYDRGWFTSIYFSDPDGQILEIATNGPGYDLDEPIDRLGETVALPKPSQIRGQRDEAAIAAHTHPEPVPHIDHAMILDGLHHVTGIVDDLAVVGAFYEKALGLALVKRSVNQDDGRTPHLFWANYDRTRVAKHSSITQFGWPGSTYAARAGAGQTHHVAWRAGDAHALREWEAHLNGLGVVTTPIAAQSGYESFYFGAPDGLIMEMAADHA
jgi:glyoxalase family protein